MYTYGNKVRRLSRFQERMDHNCKQKGAIKQTILHDMPYIFKRFIVQQKYWLGSGIPQDYT